MAKVRTTILPGDLDPRRLGNVLLWHHDPDSPEPVRISLVHIDAAHALAADPERYTLDPKVAAEPAPESSAQDKPEDPFDYSGTAG